MYVCFFATRGGSISCDVILLQCNHDDEQRALTGCWASPELVLAIQNDYKLLQVHEVLLHGHTPYLLLEFQVYEVWSYGKSTEVRRDLFADYIDTLLKYKVQYGGFPSDSPEDVATYLQFWREKEGIDIRREDVTFNPAYYVTVKRFLNSLWG